jgi:hypothetical protein
MAIRNFFTPEPGRGKPDKTNVVFADIIDSLANKRPEDGGVNTHMLRAEEAGGESRFMTAARHSIQRTIDLLELLKAGVADEQRRINGEDRDRRKG